MRKPLEFAGPPSYTLHRSMVIIMLLNGTLGLFGYLRYGELCAGSISLNLPPDNRLVYFAIYIYTINSSNARTIHLWPLQINFERLYKNIGVLYSIISFNDARLKKPFTMITFSDKISGLSFSYLSHERSVFRVHVIKIITKSTKSRFSSINNVYEIGTDQLREYIGNPKYFASPNRH